MIHAFILICSVRLPLRDQQPRYSEVALETFRFFLLTCDTYLGVNPMKFAKLEEASEVPLLKRL